VEKEKKGSGGSPETLRNRKKREQRALPLTTEKEKGVSSPKRKEIESFPRERGSNEEFSLRQDYERVGCAPRKGKKGRAALQYNTKKKGKKE